MIVEGFALCLLNASSFSESNHDARFECQWSSLGCELTKSPCHMLPWRKKLYTWYE